MTLRTKGLLTLAAHCLLVCGVAGKYAVDRSRLPRVWARTVPIDPDSLTRGRYVSLRVCLDQPVAAGRVKLRISDGRLIGESSNDGRLQIFAMGARSCLMNPSAFYIPEHVADPSVLKPGEELWVEISVPENAEPRPLRLGVKRDGVLKPMAQ